MRAVVLYEHGGFDRLRYVEDFPDPAIGPGDVLVRVLASSLNYHDLFTLHGMPGIKIPMPVIMGLDIAGEIAAVGPEVSGWTVGDRVLVDPVNRVEGGLMGETLHGGFAELCKVRAHQLIRLPDEVGCDAAATLPIAYGTALRMMQTIGHVAAGERVLVLGASGGVGVCCIMLAKLAGAEVIACTSSNEKAERLRRLGADHVINVAETDFMAAVHARYGKPARRSDTGGVDVVVNYTGGDSWVKSLRCLRRGGRLLTCGATAGYAPAEDIRYIWTFELQILGSNNFRPAELTQLLEMVRSGRLTAIIDRRFPLSGVGEALRLLEERKVFGKLVITPQAAAQPSAG
ncbi:MAG TPA: zinc-binding dehydrogenase [Stellaceae bacterium]|nr:zinc-binding dehydrogenase [Stellaceae bacterium]